MKKAVGNDRAAAEIERLGERATTPSGAAFAVPVGTAPLDPGSLAIACEDGSCLAMTQDGNAFVMPQIEGATGIAPAAATLTAMQLCFVDESDV